MEEFVAACWTDLNDTIIKTSTNEVFIYFGKMKVSPPLQFQKLCARTEPVLRYTEAVLAAHFGPTLC